MRGSVAELVHDLRVALRLCAEQDPVEEVARRVRALGTGEGFKAWIQRAFAAGAFSVRERDLGHVDGRLIFDGGQYHILLNSRRPVTRRLFSLAHEIGHLVLESHLPHLSSDLKERSLFHPDWDLAEERVVDRLAAAMLMPAGLVSSIIAEHRTAIQSIVALTREYGVSIGAAERRYREITGRAIGVLECKYLWKTNRIAVVGRHGDRRLTAAFEPGIELEVGKLGVRPIADRTQAAVFTTFSATGVAESVSMELCWLNAQRVVCAI